MKTQVKKGYRKYNLMMEKSDTNDAKPHTLSGGRHRDNVTQHKENKTKHIKNSRRQMFCLFEQVGGKKNDR